MTLNGRVGAGFKALVDLSGVAEAGGLDGGAVGHHYLHHLQAYCHALAKQTQ